MDSLRQNRPRSRRLVDQFIAILLLCTATLAGAQDKAAPSILLANVLGANVDITKYLVSEKYDGVRAIWDGKTLRFRSGRDVTAPTWFIAALPPEPLDGELWIARGRFDELSGIVRKTLPDDLEWQRIKYMIFELPQSESAPITTFSERVTRMQAIVERSKFSALKVVPQFHVKDRAALKRELLDVTRAGGEGLMLHRADAPYVTGRSDALLKLKLALDTEAKVVAHIPGKGKYRGQMGALLVETKDGVRFKLGTGFSDAIRANPPPVGAMVTYTYRDVTPNGKPRFASFLRIRNDP
jgi:DNA ligase 1